MSITSDSIKLPCFYHALSHSVIHCACRFSLKQLNTSFWLAVGRISHIKVVVSGVITQIKADDTMWRDMKFCRKFCTFLFEATLCHWKEVSLDKSATMSQLLSVEWSTESCTELLFCCLPAAPTTSFAHVGLSHWNQGSLGGLGQRKRWE